MISLLLTLFLVLRGDVFQTVAMRLVADYLSKELNTEIRIGGFNLSFKNGLIMEDVKILDHQKEIIFSAHKLGVRPGLISFKIRKLSINKVFIEKGIVQLLTHRGDSALNMQFIVDYFASKDRGKRTDTTPAVPWHISISSVILKDTRFHFQDENEQPVSRGMDYANIDASGINLEVSDVTFEGDSISGNIGHLAATERSGIILHNLSGEFRVGPRFLKANQLKIRTDHSDLSLSFSFLYDRWGAFNDFLNKINIQAKVEPSFLDIQDIGYFASELADMRDKFHISGNIKGSVSNFKARDLKVAFGNHTSFYGDISALGLPDVEETFIDLNIKAMTTTKKDIESLIIPGEMHHLELPAILANLGILNLKGNFTGFYNDFVATAQLNTSLGSLSTDLSLKKQPNSKLIGYQGQLNVGWFDIGKLTGNTDDLGRVTFRADLNGKGFNLDDADLTMKVRIDSIFLNSYKFRNLDVTGALADKKFNGSLNVDDPNLKLNFDGSINMRDSLPDFDFTAQIHHARLFELKLLSRDSVENLSASVKVNFKGSNLDNIDGSIQINDCYYAEGNKLITMDNLSLLTRQDTASGKSYHLQSDFVDADITGNFSFKALIPSLTTFIQNYLASFNLNDSLIALSHTQSNQKMNYEVRFKESDEVTNMFLPFLRISPNSIISGFYNEDKGTIVMTGKSPALYFNNIELTDWYIDAENRYDNLEVLTGAAVVYLKKGSKKDPQEVKIDSFQLVSNIRQDSIHYRFGWKAGSNPSEFDGYASFRNSPAIELKFNRFNVFLNEKYWTVDPENFVTVDTSAINISNLAFYSGDQYLKVNGNLTNRSSDTLNVRFNKVDISKLDQLLGKAPIDVDGILNGSVKIANPYSDIILLSDLRINKFKFNKELLGDATFNLKYDAVASKVDLVSQIIYTGNVGTNIPFSLTGSYIMDNANPRFDFDLALKNLNLKMLGPFVADFMTGVNGLVSGQVKIQGTADHPDISGQLMMMRTEFKINYLNIPYSFADVVTIDSNAFNFNKIMLYDSLGNKAVLNGRITHNQFSNLHLDLNIDMDDFAAFNNSRAQNSVFYGKARASGTASITGPPDNIKITVRATNGDKTHVVIPIDLTRSVGQADYIIFIDPGADSVERSSRKYQVNATGLSLDLRLRVNQDAEVDVYFPDQLGNLKASGTGNLLMSMTPSSPFLLSGTYTLSKGFFLFQFKNLLRLPMSIKEGSTISWTGDAADANINISAVYKTKVPLKGLTTNTEEEGIRIPVECIIRLGGKLMNPDISFAINLPNVEESIKTQVYSAIDTSNAAIVTEQTIYLMVMNQFKPVITSSSSGVDVGATSMSLVTNQINSMLSQITSNVNLNMNYKPGSSTTQQEFDVGISTQLFDDRLLIDGTFGMNSYNNSTVQQSSTFVGDVNIEYVLTQNRRWRARVFNRTNTLNILNNNAPYTQGVGIKYQRDFTKFSEFFKFGKKEKIPTK
ncbi:MAG: translocation/assembly module TamB domain-containing protein [Bacteroidales bacterium]|nr:translocation/assembly module TamB domain-containing protein [Bacteroidales bacterium]